MLKKIIILTVLLLLSISISACNRIKLFNEKYRQKPEINNTIEQNSSPENIVESLYSTELSHQSGTYFDSFRLELINKNAEAEIFYTTDSNNYDIDSFNKYETPILIEKNTEILFFSKTSETQENVQKASFKIEKSALDKKEIPQIEQKELGNFINSLKLEPTESR